MARRLSSHRKREQQNVKLNDNRKLMNSGNDVIVNEWNLLFFCLRRVQLLITMEHRSKPALFEAKWKRPVGFTSRIRLTLVFMSGRVEQISGTISVGSGWRVSSSESLIWGGSATSCLHLAIGVTWTRCVNWKADCDGPIEEFLEVTVSGDVTNPLKKKLRMLKYFDCDLKGFDDCWRRSGEKRQKMCVETATSM